MSAATVTSKGQVTLPADIRREFDLQAGDRLVFFRALSGDLRCHISRKRAGAGRGSIKAKGGSIDRRDFHRRRTDQHSNRATVGELVEVARKRKSTGGSNRLARVRQCHAKRRSRPVDSGTYRTNGREP